jgi:hypothetical protein
VARNVVNEAGWAWWHKLTADIIEQTESRGVRHCKDISERIALTHNAIFPTTFARMCVNQRNRPTVFELVTAVMDVNLCPSYIRRVPLGAGDL